MFRSSVILCAAVFLAALSAPFARAESTPDPVVDYLPRAPVVDGVLDADLVSLPARAFPVTQKSSPSNPGHTAAYRIAYGAAFLYVFIELDADAIVYRDRAYQNGDGFTLVLAAPQPGDAPSNEFYVLACSAVDRKDMEWSRKVFWYYNVSSIFLPVSDETRIAFRDGDGVIAFELLLSWTDVHPYHPWLSEGIGFNLGLVNAVGEKDRTSYKVLDDGMGNENSPRRYARLRFETPHHTGEPRTFVRLARNTMSVGDTLQARAVTIAAEPFAERLRVSLLSGEKTPLDQTMIRYPCDAGLTFHDLTLDTTAPAGGYVVKWRSLTDESSGESALTILPPFDAASLNRRLDGVASRLAPGTLPSLQFMIQEIGDAVARTRSYETAAAARVQLERVEGYLEDAARGVDSFARQRGFVRRAYRSSLDGTLQPFVVRLPVDLDASRRYPLLVYLHGSAGSERDITAIKTIPDGFIALGPRGRGPSNWYSWDDAQADIAEAIAAVKADFPIDEKNVFLGGFSMGGYGVYRTYHETPRTFRAIAVFSGTPRITFPVPDGVKTIDFSDERHIPTFKDVPIFIFHGKRDMNVPYAATEAFVAQLKRAGARVEFLTEENKGHEAASDETVGTFFRWISTLAGQPGR